MAGLAMVRAAATTCNTTPAKLEIAGWSGSPSSSALVIQNVSAVTVELGGSDLVLGTGYQLYAGQTFSIDAHAGAIWAVSSSGPAALRILEAS